MSSPCEFDPPHAAHRHPNSRPPASRYDVGPAWRSSHPPPPPPPLVPSCSVVTRWRASLGDLCFSRGLARGGGWPAAALAASGDWGGAPAATPHPSLLLRWFFEGWVLGRAAGPCAVAVYPSLVSFSLTFGFVLGGGGGGTRRLPPACLAAPPDPPGRVRPTCGADRARVAGEQRPAVRSGCRRGSACPPPARAHPVESAPSAATRCDGGRRRRRRWSTAGAA